jgi:hypothetical protein
MASDNTIIVADLKSTASQRKIALSLYSAFLSNEKTKPYFLVTGELLKIFKEDPAMKDLNTVTEVSKIKNSTVILLKEVKNFYEIDITNIVVYLAVGPAIDYFVSFVLPRIDAIVATNYSTAFRLIAICKQLDITVPVYRMSPYFDVELLPLAEERTGKTLVIGNDKILDCLDRYSYEYEILGGKTLVNSKKIDKIDGLSQYEYLVYTGNSNDLLVYEAMLSGVVVVAPNRLPFTEFIVDGINGYLFSNEEDIGRAFSGDNDRIISNAIAMRNLMDTNTWVNQFLNTIAGGGAQDVRNTVGEAIVPMRRWIIPRMVLRENEEVRVPSVYDKNIFRLIDEGDLEHILIFFSSQPFRDVYIFGWEWGDAKDTARTNRINNLVRALGRRVMNMYWCTDVTVPSEWKALFNNMSVISTIEGLKRVKPV